MDTSDKVAFKALSFGIAMPLITMPLTRLIPAWLAWGIGAAVACALFHWLPPRIHQGLTPARSVALIFASGVAAAGSTALIGQLL